MLPLAFPALGGILYLTFSGAPDRYAAINGAALVAGLAWIQFGRLPEALIWRRALACALLGLLALPLATGPHVEGVSRWLPLGLVALHSGMLAVPSLVALSARDTPWGPWLLGCAAAAAALQPDAASAAAICLSALGIAWARRSRSFAGVAGLAALAGIYAFGTGDLPPQPFVERVVQSLWAEHPIRAVALASLVAIGVWHFLVEPQITRAEGYALAGALTGFAALSFIGPYPSPLIGYGVAPIVGFALALGAAPKKERRPRGDMLDIVSRLR